MSFNTDWVNHIDWTNEQTYRDLSKMLSALAQSFAAADISSGTNGVVDGHAHAGLLARLVGTAIAAKAHPKFLHVRPERNYTHHEGHKK